MQQRLFQRPLAIGTGGGANCLLKGKLRRARITHVESAIIELWRKRRQDGFDRPAAALVVMIIMCSRNGQKIDDSRGNGYQRLGQIGEEAGQLTDARTFETRIVGIDRTVGGEEL